MTPLAQLQAMLSYCRPAFSPADDEFIRVFLSDTNADEYGNRHITVGTGSTILWSAHTDTVARHSGRQTIHLDRNGTLHLSRKSRNRGRNCLGADNTAGVWLLRQMIDAGVPGTYIFHRAEEIGGRGSDWLALHWAKYLRQFSHAIAFDRRGTQDIITHQAWGRTASDDWANLAAGILNAHGFQYSPSAHGIFTDTANYSDYIPECSNISVGTASEHRSDESLDTGHLFRLRDAVCAIDWAQLPAVRDPKQTESLFYYFPEEVPLIRHDSSSQDEDIVCCADCYGAYFYSDHVCCPECGGLRLVADDQPDADSCDYLDPGWERIQRTLEGLE